MHRVLLITVMVRSSKVNNLDGAFVSDVDEDVLWFEISMGDFLAMAIGHSLQELFENVGSLHLTELVAISDLVEELSAFAQFSDQIDGTLGLIDLIESNDVWMRQVLQDVDLILQTDSFDVVHGELVDNLNCTDFVSHFVGGSSDLAEGTLA